MRSTLANYMEFNLSNDGQQHTSRNGNTLQLLEQKTRPASTKTTETFNTSTTEWRPTAILHKSKEPNKYQTQRRRDATSLIWPELQHWKTGINLRHQPRSRNGTGYKTSRRKTTKHLPLHGRKKKAKTNHQLNKPNQYTPEKTSACNEITTKNRPQKMH